MRANQAGFYSKEKEKRYLVLARLEESMSRIPGPLVPDKRNRFVAFPLMTGVPRLGQFTSPNFSTSVFQ